MPPTDARPIASARRPRRRDRPDRGGLAHSQGGGRWRRGRPLARPGRRSRGLVHRRWRKRPGRRLRQCHPAPSRRRTIVPPRTTAVPSDTAETAPTRRDRHLQHIAEHGHMAWQNASGYTRRTRVEVAVARWKQVIGDGRSRPRFHVRSMWNAGGGCAPIAVSVARPKWIWSSTRSAAGWSWDARMTSVLPDPERGWDQCARTPIHAPR